MGVPKFFRYISERYPCLSELIMEHQIAEFDNMYLDMNGIIHNCSHPDDGNIQFRITEEQIFLDIFHYIETIFDKIKPQKLFFLAIDGVAPRAKMNQQRGRRFRSAKDAERLEKIAIAKGEELPKSKRFDSNCITPGTVFMAKLQDALKDFIKRKIESNKLWQKCRIILSGHETPGEGEHKIMEYIRYLKTQSDYDPNTRHCLYGLDADLIMLSICTHEINISLLREEVKFGSKSKKHESVDNIRFYLLHIGLFRDYINLEFHEIHDKLPFEYNIDSLLDDFVLMSFMIGNDFIPHLPNLHIHANALPVLFKAYMEVLPTLDGYLNENGILNLKRFQAFLEKMTDTDWKFFEENYEDLEYLQAKRNEETFDVNIDDMAEDFCTNLELLELIQSSEEIVGSDAMNESEMFEKEFISYKHNYYINKMHYDEVTPEVLAEQTQCYITALQWTLYYYYRGIKSWTWFYSHHYAPFISDIKNCGNLTITFEIGEPFLPFEQLLAVLPPASKELLPEAYHKLMTDPSSDVIEYYPPDFETDLNGKKQEWEAVVLIPFIDEKKLLSSMKKCENLLTKSERNRNVHGPMHQYDFYASSDAYNESGTVKVVPLWRHDVDIPENNLVFGPMKGALLDVYFHGFPRLKHLSFTVSVENSRVRVFDQPSRNPSMILKLDPYPKIDLKQLAEELLDKEVLVDWPHLSEGKIISLTSPNLKIDKSGETPHDPHGFQIQINHLKNHYVTRMGIEIGTIDVLAQVCHCTNYNYVPANNGNMILTKIWSPFPISYPIQLIVKDIDVHKPRVKAVQRGEVLFSKNSVIFMISTIYYGCQGIVLDPSLLQSTGRIQILLNVYEEPDFSIAQQCEYNSKNNYRSLYASATAANISPTVFSRITGTVIVLIGERRNELPEDPPKLNVGLQMKFPKQSEEIEGYTKKIGTQYFYSSDAIDTVTEYYNKYPKLFQLLQSNSMGDIFESDIFPDEEKELNNLTKWIKQLPHTKRERRTAGTQALETDTIRAVEKSVSELEDRPHKCSKLQVKPFLLYKPGLNYRQTAPDPSADYNLLDRVVVINDKFPVPLGYKGTIIAIHPIVDPNPVRQSCLNSKDVIFNILFDKPFEDGNSIPDIAEKRVYKVSKSNLINISYGANKFNKVPSKHLQNNKNSDINHINNRPRSDMNSIIGNSKHPSNSNKQLNSKNGQFWDKLKQNDEKLPMPWNSLFPSNSSGTAAASNDNFGKVKHMDQPFSPGKDRKGDLSNKETSRVKINKQNADAQFNKSNGTKTKEFINSAFANMIKHQKYSNAETKNEESKQTDASQSIRHSSVQNEPIKKPEDGADVLRKLLRISEKTSTNVHMPKSSSAEQKMTKVDVLDLPKPPSNWQKSIKQTVNANASTETANNIGNNPYHNVHRTNEPFSQPKNPINHGRQTANFIYQPQPQQQNHNNILMYQPTVYNMMSNFPPSTSNPVYYQNHYNQQMQYSQLRKPNGPQHLSYGSSYSPGQGAFIPLQATRQHLKSKVGPPPAAQKNLDKMFNAAQSLSLETPNERVMNYSQTRNNVTTRKKILPPPVQTSRLAARFNSQN